MQLGFVSAILADLSLEDVFRMASKHGFTCVEVMCWPPGKAERRYAGVTHIDVLSLNDAEIGRIRDMQAQYGVSISSLGYYPNPLQADEARGRAEAEHIERVIEASAALGIGVMTTFVGRNPALSIDENWPRFLEVWRPILRKADLLGVKVGIENCPMVFTRDEWPGGKNLATTPAIWRRMFEDIPSPNFGLNYDPSHFIWQMIDYIAPIREFKDRIHHVHAKDARIDRERLDSHGIMGYPNLWHTPKIPGFGDVNWGRYFGALSDAGYKGPVCIEVEDRAFEGSLEAREESLKISGRYLRNYVAG